MKSLVECICESLKDWDRNDFLRLKFSYDHNNTEDLADEIDKKADDWALYRDQQQYFCIWYMVKYAGEELKKSKDGINNAPFYFDGSRAADRKTGKSIEDAVADGKHSWKEVADAIKKHFE